MTTRNTILNRRPGVLMDTDDDTLVEAILNITNINLSMRLLCLLERICRIDALIQTIINNQTTISELRSRIQDQTSRIQTTINNSRIQDQITINNQTSRIQDPINYEMQSRIQDPLDILSSNNPLDILRYYNLI